MAFGKILQLENGTHLTTNSLLTDANFLLLHAYILCQTSSAVILSNP